MFEFELKGGMDELKKDGELLDYLGFNRKEDGSYPSDDYDNVCKTYGLNVETDELENEYEENLRRPWTDFFPRELPCTSPFWNMKLHEVRTRTRLMLLCMVLKLLVPLRSTDPQAMRILSIPFLVVNMPILCLPSLERRALKVSLKQFLQVTFSPFWWGIGVTRMH